VNNPFFIVIACSLLIVDIVAGTNLPLGSKDAASVSPAQPLKAHNSSPEVR
jgi:hypothetical protein